MIDLPFNPDDLGDSMLARFLHDDPLRVPVLANICRLLDHDGRVGDDARYYIVRKGPRRAAFRGTLDALAIPHPTWAIENADAAQANRQFVAQYRDQYARNQCAQRLRTERPNPTLSEREQLFTRKYQYD
ncbi:MAG TPA: hypothetical protein VF463_07775 [Sphingobium sp.]